MAICFYLVRVYFHYTYIVFGFYFAIFFIVVQHVVKNTLGNDENVKNHCVKDTMIYCNFVSINSSMVLNPFVKTPQREKTIKLIL